MQREAEREALELEEQEELDRQLLDDGQFLSLIQLSGESGGGVRPHRHQYWRVQSCQSTVHLPTFSLFSIKGIQTNHCLFYIF